MTQAQASEGPALVWSPFPDGDSAAAAASTLLDERLVACANILPPMRSLYLWRGARAESSECGALFKTDAALLDRAVARLGDIHPYEQPAVVGWRCDSAPPATLAWLGGLLP